MSGLAELPLKTDYRKGQDDIGHDFYLPCMSVATRYDRAVGFFNSAIYIIAWPSLKEFVGRNGRMRLVCSPVLQANDIDAIETGYSQRFEAESALRLRDDIKYMLATPYLHKPATVLATLIALDVVDVRIAFMKKTGRHERLFHDKLGIFHDNASNAVAFKGSMNETWAGLSEDGNLESVDVFLSWEHEREAKRVRENQAYFEALWSNEFEQDGVNVRKFPDIAKDELLRAADKDRWPELVDEICREMKAAEKFEAVSAPDAIVLRPHQAAALTKWEELGRRGIFEHATGSGKTITAIAAIRNSLSRKEVPVVFVPSELLLDQWNRELSDQLKDIKPQILRCGAGYTRWRGTGLLAAWTRGASETPRIVLSTMQTGAMPDFLSGVVQGEHLLFVADEVHRIGSPNHQSILAIESGPRIGLSATPRRAGDPDGTARIFEYFGGVVPPPFTLQDAIRSKALTPYFYHVHTVSLNEAEQAKWDDDTGRIRKLAAQSASAKSPDTDAQVWIQRLLIERARILKQAAGKVQAATTVLLNSYRRGDRWIVYCDDLKQLEAVRAELTKHGIDSMEYHSSMLGDKEQTIRLFETNGGIIVSIRCLDEGVDIPSVSHALILASSKNPREYIQRRGRVLRRAEGKNVAAIHDVLVLPVTEDQGDDAPSPRLNIIAGEIARSLEFGKSALNPASITDLERIALRFTKDYKTLIDVGYEDDE